MAKSKRNQNPTKSLPTVQTTHSHSMNTGTDERASTVETYISVSATPGEDAGVCVVCEDECTCGAAAAAASKATMTLSTTKKRLILKMPRPQNQPDNEAGGDHVRRIQSASFSPPGPHFDLPRIVPQKKGPPFKTELHLRQAAAHAARPVLPSNGRRNGTGPNDKFNGITLPSTILAAHDLPLNLSPAGLPTFIPASVFGSDSSLSSPSSESDDTSSSSSDDSLENGDTDSEIEAEEERLIVQETLAMQKLRARREQLDNARLETSTDENGRRRWDKMHWSNRERHGSVGPGNMLSDSDASGSRSSDSGSSGDDEHDDDDGEDDDAELHASSASGFGWSDYDDNFDADIFFANLSDSSFDSSDSDSDPEPEQSHPLTAPTARSSDGGVPLRGVIGASLLSYSDIYSSAPLPLVVTENWDGQLVFANGMKDGEEMMDVIFGTAALENDALLTTQAGSIHGTDEQETQDVDSDDRDDDYEKLDEPDDGETTDEDELHPELGPILFANSPFSESSNLHPAHNHRSTLSNVNHRVLQTRRHKNPSTKGVSSRLTPALSTSSGSQTFEPSKLIPSIGSFTISGDLGLGTSSAIIDGSRSEILPSPYSRPKHRKRRAVKQSGASSRSPKRARHDSQPITPTPLSPLQPPSAPLLGPKAGRGEAESSAPDDAHTIPQGPPPPIDLRDVLHVAVLDDQLSHNLVNASDANSSEARSMRNRWERIPINAFHRLRSAVQVHGGVLGSPVNTTVTLSRVSSAFDLSSSPAPASPKPADGFSYGSTPSVVSPYAEHGSFWDHHTHRAKSLSERRLRRKSTLSIAAAEPRQNRLMEGAKRKMLVSPIPPMPLSLSPDT